MTILSYESTHFCLGCLFAIVIFWVFPILRADLDHIKTTNGGDSDAQTVLIWSKSAGKIARKIAFKIRKFGITIANKHPSLIDSLLLIIFYD